MVALKNQESSLSKSTILARIFDQNQAFENENAPTEMLSNLSGSLKKEWNKLFFIFISISILCHIFVSLLRNKSRFVQFGIPYELNAFWKSILFFLQEGMNLNEPRENKK